MRELIEELLGSLTANCGSDEQTLQRRTERLRGAGYEVDIVHHETEYPVDSVWVLGHLMSAVSEDQIGDEAAISLDGRIDSAIPTGSVERVLTSMIIATAT